MKTEDHFDIEEIDVEEYVRRGEIILIARRYIIRVDKQRLISNKRKITGAEILALAGKTPETYKLYQHKRGHQPSLVGPHHVVDLGEDGVERFTTMAKDTTEGMGAAAQAVQRQFRLPDSDEAYLVGMGLGWETVNDNGTLWLLINGWKVPSGYNHQYVSVGLIIPPNYPDTQIDMVYFYPALTRLDGRPIGALSTQPIIGQEWQRWSRHRTAANPWRPAEDDIASHLSLVDEWLVREFEKA